MKKTLKNSLFDKNRFKWMEEEKKKWLQNLTLEESIRMTEEFLSSRMFEKFRDRFTYTEPVCFKLGLNTRKENVRKRI